MPSSSQGLTRLQLVWLERKRRLQAVAPFAKAAYSTNDKDTTEQTVWNDLLFGVAGRYAALNASLAPATIAATATVDVSAAVSRTLGTASLAATGTLDISAALSKTLDGVTLVATGTIQQSETLAALSQTLGAATLASSAQVALNAAVAATLADSTIASSAILDVAASVAKALDPVALTATAEVALAAYFSAQLGDATLSGRIGDAAQPEPERATKGGFGKEEELRRLIKETQDRATPLELPKPKRKKATPSQPVEQTKAPVEAEAAPESSKLPEPPTEQLDDLLPNFAAAVAAPVPAVASVVELARDAVDDGDDEEDAMAMAIVLALVA